MTIKKEEAGKRTFGTGADKQNAEGKGTPVLFPPDAYIDLSIHFEEGGKLHGDRNWEKGIPLSELINSLERHIQQEKMGLTDENHDRAIAWNAIVYLATKLRIGAGILPEELADIPPIYESENFVSCGCKVCDGTGYIQQPKDNNNHIPDCSCPYCNGTGLIKKHSEED